MKKNIIIFFVFFTLGRIFAWEFFNLPREYSFFYDEMGNKNILAHNADALEKRYNIKVCIFKYRGDVNKDMNEVAVRYFRKLTEKDNNRQLFIFMSKKRKHGIILITDDLKGEIDEKYLKVLQDDVLRSLSGRWYISEARVLGKVLGGIIYLLEKDNIDKKNIAKIKSDLIVVDNFFYILSRKPLFSELIDLFEFEPISFFFYFPFIIHFLFVRVIGMKFQKTGFIVSNIIWFLFVAFVFYLIFNRIDILFHEYTRIFNLFLALNIPLYFYLTNLYKNEIEVAVYDYLYNITGGFDTKNVFESKGWEKER